MKRENSKIVPKVVSNGLYKYHCSKEYNMIRVNFKIKKIKKKHDKGEVALK